MEKGKKSTQTAVKPDDRLKPSDVDKIVTTRKEQMREGQIVRK